MIDILLVNSNSSLQIYQNLNKISQLEPPIWASLTAKNLSLKGIHTFNFQFDIIF